MKYINIKRSYNIYKGSYINDTMLCDFVGEETYKALYHFAPELYLEVTYPMEANQYSITEIRNIYALDNSITSRYIKYLLIVRYFEGSSENTYLIENLVNSSEVMDLPDMSPITNKFYIFLIFIILSITVYLIHYHILPSLNEKTSFPICYFGENCYFG